MSNWYSTIYKAFIITSMISFIIGFFTKANVSLGAYIAGYSVLILGIMMILIILFNDILRVSNNSLFQTLISIVMTSGPFLLILAVLIFVLYLFINYKNHINAAKIFSSYSSFSKIIILLLLFQSCLVYASVSNDSFESNGKLSKITISLLYLIGILTSICSIILYTILKYYSTDGFSNVNLS